jgi:hypothetical protein
MFGSRLFKYVCLCVCLSCSLISDDLRKGLVDRAEHTFQLALTLALSCGVVVMVLMEVCVWRGGGGRGGRVFGGGGIRGMAGGGLDACVKVCRGLINWGSQGTQLWGGGHGADRGEPMG